ncbi:DUF4214 domain-containing protein [Mesobacterium sp. TK19101]|uniref:DUF4214 domain-containing protein n=1 Tax=Mesobacterium hydrothermale TaxID=3111907 RepID=A0ABU6HJM9_9RHOB|nr:DUF4214 domain-containing protein [Mesobacterium sp. TK19101]MEC3862669.1 DUF4214 domain-containing protein [Mesobacterium sp. TK19101]
MAITPQNDVIFGSGDGFFGRLGSSPASAVLSDGRIALVWTEYQYPGDGSIPGIDFDTWTRVLNADGTAATEATIVNDTRVGSHAKPEVVALPDGGYAVSWVAMTRAEVAGSGDTVYLYDAFLRSYTAAGTAEGPAVQVSERQSIFDPADRNSMLASEVQTLNLVDRDAGGAVLVYALRGGDGAYDEDGTWARLIGNDGQPTGNPVRIWTGNVFSVEAAQLTSGDFVFIEFAGDLYGYNIRLTGAALTNAPSSVAGATGPVDLSHDPQPDQNAGGYVSAPRVTALSGGGFAVAYGYNGQLGTDNDESIRLDRFDAAGQLQSTVTIAVPNDTVQQPGEIPYQILGLSGGRVLVTWSHAVTYGDTDIKGVVVNADGTFESEPAVINPNTTGYQLLGDLGLLPTGDAFMTLADASGTLIGGVADNMHGLFLDLPAAPTGGGGGGGTEPPAGVLRTGTTGPDALTGTAQADTLIGLSGSDTVSGGAAADVLYGDSFLAAYAPGPAAQVYRLYQATLDRAPDAGGHLDWTGRIAAGDIDIRAAAGGFVNSAEFQAVYGALTNTQFVELLYQNVLGRAADAGGLASWVGQLGGGATRAQVVVGFSESPEFVSNTAAEATAFTAARNPAAWSDEVFRAYHATLDRDPDLGGFTDWIGRLAGGTPLVNTISGFVNSAEFQATYGALTNTQFVQQLYQNVLNRAADAGGLANWVGQLDGGTTRAQVVLGFSESPEFVSNMRAPLETWMRAQGPDDVLTGGPGDDTLGGGAFADRFVFAATDAGQDTVLDLEAWDTLVFDGFGYADAAAARSHMTQTGADVSFADQGVTVLLANTQLAQISDDMIAV